MTGVAAQLTGRNCVLIELSPLASSIAYSLNTSTGQDTLIRDANKIVEEVEKQFGNLVQAEISGEKYPLAYCVWAAKLSCPYCGTNFNLWDVSVDEVEWDEIEEFTCPKCQAELTYTDCNKVREENGFTEFEPVRVSIVQGRKRVERRPNASDLKRIAQAQVMTPAYWYPDYSVADGDKLSEPKQAHGLTRVSQFFTKRNLLILSHLWAEVVKNDNIMLRAAFTASLRRLTRFNRYMAKHKLNRSRELVGPLAKTVHIPAIFFEANPLIYFKKKAREYSRLKLPDGTGIRISTQSATDMPNIPSNSIDYIFTDPPFGANIQYSELNFVTESWLRAFTNASREAIISGAQDKRENDYYSLIYDSFRELYRILKPGRWLTVEFHSSSSTIWNLIQSALAH
jgi:adenine-specific DNA methylase